MNAPWARLRVFGGGYRGILDASAWRSELARRFSSPADLLLPGILVVAAVVRLAGLGRVGLRGDEAVYAGQAAVLAGAGGFDRYFLLLSRGNSNFLLFQEVLSLVYRVFGVGDVTARVVAATFSTLTVLVTYSIATTLFGRRTGLFSALLLALSGYAVTLGRLALLDSTLTFCFAAAMLCAVKWIYTRRAGWLYGFAVALALTIQAKMAGGVLLVVLGLYLVITRSLDRLTVRVLVRAAGAFAVAFVPAIVQLAANWGLFTGFLSTSVRRSSDVPWYYYGQTLLAYESPLIVALWTVGIAYAIGRRARADVLPLLWLLAVVGFYQLYPLKAFNYLLPAIPALSILSGRALDAGVQLLRRGSWRLAAGGALAALLVGVAVPSLRGVWRDDRYAGLREAADWIASSTPARAGVMTISHGSAQYVFSFYARRDAYPFGRFNLATVLPGGKVVAAGAPAAGSRTPRDWIATWPARLIADGSVSYLVYYTTAADDPPEESQVVENSSQRKFRELIERYGGQLVHTVYRHHEGRAWVYQLTASRPHPVLSFSISGARITVRGAGFTDSAAVSATYNGRQVAIGRTAADGTLVLSFPLPAKTQPRHLVVVTDARGRYGSLVLPRPVLSYTTGGVVAVVRGAGFAKDSPITVTYHNQLVARSRSAGDGSMSVRFRIPARTFPRWTLVATDGIGNHAAMTLPKPKLRASLSGGRVVVHGSAFTPRTLVTLSYHGRFVTSARADSAGNVSVSFPLPTPNRPRWPLVVKDTAGNYALTTHLGRK